MAKEKRFVEVHTETMGSHKIYVDRETGVHYLFISNLSAGGGGVTPLLGADGKPVVQRID